MNKSIIDNIYYADRVFHEENIETEEYIEATKEYCKHYEELLATLNKEQQKMLDNLFLLSGGVMGAGYSKKFKDGFIFGFKLAAEIFKT